MSYTCEAEKQEIAAEIEDSSRYKKTGICFMCGCSIPTTDEHYRKNGNGCVTCCGRSGLILNKKITRQQAFEMLAERRLKVKQGLI